MAIVRTRPITSRPMLDPSKRDWIIKNGRLVDDETHLSTVLFLLSHQRGTSCAYPGIGCRWHTIKKILPNTPREAETMAIEALSPLTRESSRKIFRLKATGQRTGPVTIAVLIEWYDAKGRYNAIRRFLSVGT